MVDESFRAFLDIGVAGGFLVLFVIGFAWVSRQVIPLHLAILHQQREVLSTLQTAINEQTAAIQGIQYSFRQMADEQADLVEENARWQNQMIEQFNCVLRQLENVLTRLDNLERAALRGHSERDRQRSAGE